MVVELYTIVNTGDEKCGIKWEKAETVLNERLPGCYVTDHTVATIANARPKLQRLCLSSCNLITDRSLIALSKSCPEIL